MAEIDPQEGQASPPDEEGALATPVGEQSDGAVDTDAAALTHVEGATPASAEEIAPLAGGGSAPASDVGDDAEAVASESADVVQPTPGEGTGLPPAEEPAASGSEAGDVAAGEPALEPTEPVAAEAQPVAQPVAATVAQPAAAPEAVRRPKVPWWPFLLYLAVWLGGVGAAAWLFLSAPRAASIAGESLYPYMLRAGLVLTALGPVLAIVVWFVTWILAERGSRRGLLADALLKGALTTLLGVVVWWVMLVAVDRARLGRLW